MKKRIVSAILIMSCISLILVVTPQARGTQFFLASWSYPDAHGQGISTWYLQSNRTGSWVTYESNGYLQDEDPVSWNVSQVMRLMVWCSLNGTVTGATSLTDGLRHIRHNVSVDSQYSGVVFSQQNFTLDYNITDTGMYWYRHAVILNFLPLEGEFYTITVLMQIYY